jgi:hypothetical protein
MPAWGYGLLPPPTEALAVAYWAPLMAPLPVTTRLPKPELHADSVAPMLRVEAAGGFLRQDEFLYDVSIILHSYAPQSDEADAEINLQYALGWGAQAYGTTVTVKGVDWFILHSWITGAALKQNDPLVNMPRYRAMVTWRIPGKPIAAPNLVSARLAGAGVLSATAT